jgi:hypothetical protein
VRYTDSFTFSHHPFAVDYSTLRWKGEWGYIAAVWFRRKRGVTSANIGELRNLTRRITDDPVVFLSDFTDGRYGGYCYGRWDGEQYWGSGRPEVMDGHIRILKPMLERFHENRTDPWVPDNYTKWWTFRESRRKS